MAESGLDQELKEVALTNKSKFEATVDYGIPLGEMIDALRELGVDVDGRIATRRFDVRSALGVKNIIVGIPRFGTEATTISQDGPGGAYGKLHDIGLRPMNVHEMFSWILGNHEVLRSQREGRLFVVALDTQCSDGGGWPQWVTLSVDAGRMVVWLSGAGGERGTEFGGNSRFGGSREI